MSQTPQVRVVNASPLGATFDAQDGTVDLTFVLEDGDHLHVLLTPAGLDNLSRHIEHVCEQMRDQTARE